jgi:hypothetical protein
MGESTKPGPLTEGQGGGRIEKGQGGGVQYERGQGGGATKQLVPPGFKPASGGEKATPASSGGNSSGGDSRS